MAKPLYWCFLLVFLLFSVFLSENQLVRSDDNVDEPFQESDDDNLLTKIKCKIGDKYEYVMATQSSLMEKNDANLLIKTKLEVKCMEKKMWLNESSGQLKNGQLLEARITAIMPMHLSPADNQAETVTIKNGRIQMAALFASLEQMPDSTFNKSFSGSTNGNKHPKQPNLKVGAVNQFFTDFAKSFGELVSQLFKKLVKFFENLLKRSKSGNAVRSNGGGISWKCRSGQTVTEANGRSGRQKRHHQSFKSINFAQFHGQFAELFKHPFSFIQLEEGSVQSVQLSPAERNPMVMHFKRFLAQAFSTNLNRRSKVLKESSSLGSHLSHYQIEYDEVDGAKVTPEQYMADAVGGGGRAAKRAKRQTADTPHLVSVLRVVRQEDILLEEPSGKERNQYLHRKAMRLADVPFSAQQVQLVDRNIIVASGGYFHSVLPVNLKNDAGSGGGGGGGLQRKARSTDSNSNSGNNKANQTSEEFDDVLSQFMTLSLEYSMVRVTKNRWRRSVDSQLEGHPSTTYNQTKINGAIANYMNKFKINAKSLTSNTASSLYRRKRDATAENGDGGLADSNVVCNLVPDSVGRFGDGSRTANDQREDLNVIKDHLERENQLKECYEYKEFGSGWLKAFYNRSILTGARRGKSLDNFSTKYRLGAQMMGENLFMGQIDISRNNDASKLRINLFGSEYLDLNLCDIRDKVFQQANQIPLFAENIWFMTNVAINIKYDLQFKLQVPSIVCENGTAKEAVNNNVILSRMIQDEFNLNQNTKIDLGGAFEASFLIFNGEMKLNGNFDMESNTDFSQSCLSARSIVRPMNVSLDFNYKFFHPLCGEWQEDSWIPKQLAWNLNKPYRSSWFNNVCV